MKDSEFYVSFNKKPITKSKIQNVSNKLKGIRFKAGLAITFSVMKPISKSWFSKLPSINFFSVHNLFRSSIL